MLSSLSSFSGNLSSLSSLLPSLYFPSSAIIFPSIISPTLLLLLLLPRTVFSSLCLSGETLRGSPYPLPFFFFGFYSTGIQNHNSCDQDDRFRQLLWLVSMQLRDIKSIKEEVNDVVLMQKEGEIITLPARKAPTKLRLDDSPIHGRLSETLRWPQRTFDPRRGSSFGA